MDHSRADLHLAPSSLHQADSSEYFISTSYCSSNSSSLTYRILSCFSSTFRGACRDGKDTKVGELGQVLDVLREIKNEMDSTQVYTWNCREGSCGSCSMNIDGTNTVACLCSVNMDPKYVTTITPLPHLYVIKDLVVDMAQVYQQCNTACPSYWWNQEQFLGQPASLAANRWIMDSRDDYTQERIDYLDDEYKLGRCHTILNCARTCPKSLNPGKGHRPNSPHAGHKILQ